MSVMSNPFNMGHLIEGVIEQDPMTDRYVIRTEKDGKPVTFDPQEALEALNGQAVRFTLVSFENLQKLAALVEDAGGGQVQGVGTLGDGSGIAKDVLRNRELAGKKD
jgi:hypothetical protein